MENVLGLLFHVPFNVASVVLRAAIYKSILDKWIRPFNVFSIFDCLYIAILAHLPLPGSSSLLAIQTCVPRFKASRALAHY